MEGESLIRRCPCSQELCIKAWQVGTKNEKCHDEDEDLIYHCNCHKIDLGKIGAHCTECVTWLCQSCIFTPNNLVKEFVSSDEESDDIFCKKCYTKWICRKRGTLQEEIKTKKRKERGLGEEMYRLEGGPDGGIVK